ncbi:uncharacterized protein LOC116924059 isoform X2 [Daphnia magna]|uniref:uncharacterized protein LOC116924059 isoform X2 n=1 Tax=Daphnia magna TaxID=35525 RepID=UPI0006E86C7E|nr:uncharacterized protein LOC116924059 isoform X2 [Daphnia magna]
MKEDWNIDRNKFEPDEQWELKRKFIETHKHRFPKERVVCLAQVLVNMEFLGAKYPVETMKTVMELSKNIIEGFREKQKARLQRTFVEASDAASSKVKGFRHATTSKCQIEKNTAESNARYFMGAILSSNLKNISGNDNNELSERDTTQLNPPSAAYIENGNNVESSKKRKRKKETRATEKLSLKNAENYECTITQNDSQTYEEHEAFVQPASKKRTWEKDEDVGPRIPNFVIIMPDIQRKKITKHAKNKANSVPSYRIIIETSARLSSVDLKVKNFFFKQQGQWQSVLYIGGRKIVSSYHENEKMSQRGVYELAFPILEKTHYQMIITDTICISIDHFIALEEDIRQARTENSVRTTITKDVMEGKHLSTNSAFEVLSKEESIAAQPVNCAAAMKMMKKMGWSEGTGLGAKKQGIVEPIKSDVIVGRKGIGYDGSGGKNSFVKLIRRYLNNYMNSFSVHTIIFSNEFSTDQRKRIHLIAHKLKLHSSSIGREPNRQLTVRRSRRKRPLVELLNELIESQGEDPLFEKMYLIPPTE